MCGIAGIVDLRGRAPVDAALLQRMNDAQRRRGPDGAGTHVEPRVGLAHRRLAIIDLSGGVQPLYNEDRSVVVTFNGEIYDYQSLFRELEARGHRFATRSDTEVLVHAWEEWGPDSVTHLAGMFAYAIWDSRQRQLFLARDRLGKKPLYYAELDNGQFIFGSELKVLLQHPALRREIDEIAVEDYFALGYVPDPRTILRTVRKLEPGHTLTLVLDQPVPKPRPYWALSFQRQSALNEAEACEQVVGQLRDAVRKRMVADVPLGAFLSGGVDSSAVVSQMSGLSERPVVTCSVSFGDPRFNESQFAAMVADRYHTNHSVERVDSDDFDLLDTLAEVYDEPFADSSALPTLRVCELARRHVKVALSGDAGDETLAGYRRYRWHMNEEQVRARLPLGVRRALFGTAGRLYPKLDWAPRFLRAKATLLGMARDSVEGYFNSVAITTDEMRRGLFSDSFRRKLDGYHALDVFRGHAANAPVEDALSLVQYLDFKTYLPGDILTKVDRASMWHGLEVRVPMLDHRFVEWAATLPQHLKLRAGEGKYVLKKAMESYLPREVLYRPKMGFGVPIGAWFRGPLRQAVRDRLLGAGLERTGYFNAQHLERIVDQHQSGARDFGPTLWALLMFEAFWRRVIDTPASEGPA
jgi:asparagine synthase (glutamine-hydrolysing)